MYKGMYVAMSGAVLKSQELDSVANNLANISTPGYKKTTFSSYMYPIMKDVPKPTASVYPDARAMAYFGEYFVDKSEGNIRTTGNSLDFAIKGEGYFAVDNKGKVNYTRNGSFALDNDGFLVTGNKSKVLSSDGKPINLNGKAVTVSPDGNITADGNTIATLKLVKIDNITPVGESQYSGKETGASNGEIAQGNLEMSNVNPIREMIGIISALREFETAQKVISSFNDLSQRTVSDIAKV